MDRREHTADDSTDTLCPDMQASSEAHRAQHFMTCFIQFCFYFLRPISNHEHQQINLTFSFFLSVHIGGMVLFSPPPLRGEGVSS
jgi:hypothetical protein